jgi:hypothetical protein
VIFTIEYWRIFVYIVNRLLEMAGVEMSEEQKNIFYSIIKDAYKQGIESEKITVASLLEEITEKLEILIVKK